MVHAHREDGSIRYGEVPAGYKQVLPENNAPPRLYEGYKDQYWVEAYNANRASGVFMIRRGKAVNLERW